MIPGHAIPNFKINFLIYYKLGIHAEERIPKYNFDNWHEYNNLNINQVKQYLDLVVRSAINIFYYTSEYTKETKITLIRAQRFLLILSDNR